MGVGEAQDLLDARRLDRLGSKPTCLVPSPPGLFPFTLSTSLSRPRPRQPRPNSPERRKADSPVSAFRSCSSQAGSRLSLPDPIPLFCTAQSLLLTQGWEVRLVRSLLCLFHRFHTATRPVQGIPPITLGHTETTVPRLLGGMGYYLPTPHSHTPWPFTLAYHTHTESDLRLEHSAWSPPTQTYIPGGGVGKRRLPSSPPTQGSKTDHVYLVPDCGLHFLTSPFRLRARPTLLWSHLCTAPSPASTQPEKVNGTARGTAGPLSLHQGQRCRE